MTEQKDKKSGLHSRSKHKQGYDFQALTERHSELKPFVFENQYKIETIDFSDPKAVIALNTALIKLHYNIDTWEIPENYLCPPVPGRADYMHHVADLLAEDNEGKLPKGSKFTCLDLGTGASCIYPIIGCQEYHWSFIASETSTKSIASAIHIVSSNTSLKRKIDIRRQHNKQDYFRGVLKLDERIHLSICNPPFHKSPEDALKGTIRKWKNLGKKELSGETLNFGGVENELWCKGGELRFIKDLMHESRHFAKQCNWFTSLVSKQDNLIPLQKILANLEAVEIKVLDLNHGNKTSRIIAWSFQTQKSRIENMK